MPIEGTLRDFGIHDVFQLLDLSRKTGMLRVSSMLRRDEGHVFFDTGRVVHAILKSKPVTELKGMSERDVERRVRQQIETTVYDLMSWNEGKFSFEEREIEDIPSNARVMVPTESLLMEGARRVDEWSRIASKVPNVAVIPALSKLPDEHETKLDLLPHEWEVLTMIDGQRDLKGIAAALNRAEFDIAKIVYGLVTIGVVEIKQVMRPSIAGPRLVVDAPDPEIRASLDRGFVALSNGDLVAATTSLERFLLLSPTDAGAPRARQALDAIVSLQNAMEAHKRGG
jgi:hypothetical protein